MGKSRGFIIRYFSMLPIPYYSFFTAYMTANNNTARKKMITAKAMYVCILPVWSFLTVAPSSMVDVAEPSTMPSITRRSNP
jgi:hypothetical protein